MLANFGIGALGVVLASRAGNVLRQAVQHPRRIGFNAAGVDLQDAIAALAQPPTALVARPCGRLAFVRRHEIDHHTQRKRHEVGDMRSDRDLRA